MGCESGKTANMNGLWIDRWYMRQDWIRPALAAAAITSLFYAENCKKLNPLPCCWLIRRAFRAELRVSFTVKKHKKIPIVIKPGRYGRAAHGGIWSWFMTTHSQNYEFVWPKDWKNMVQTARYGWLMQRFELRDSLIWKSAKKIRVKAFPYPARFGFELRVCLTKGAGNKKFNVNYEIVWCELRDFLTAITRLFDSEKRDFA